MKQNSTPPPAVSFSSHSRPPIGGHPKEMCIDVSDHQSSDLLVSRLVQRSNTRRPGESAEQTLQRLIVWALTLSNLYAGHSCLDADGIRYDPGTDFIIEGSEQQIDFKRDILGRLDRWVQRLGRNLLYEVEPDKRDLEMLANKNQQNRSNVMFMPKSLARQSEANRQGIFQQMRTLNKLDPSTIREKDQVKRKKEELQKEMDARRLDVAERLLDHREDTYLEEVIAHCCFYSDAMTEAGLEKDASRAHLGRLMLHRPLAGAAGWREIRRVVMTAAERAKPHGQSASKVRMDLALTASEGLLEELLAGLDTRKEAAQILWLVESSPACGLPEAEGGPVNGGKGLDFDKICKQELIKRINFRNALGVYLPALGNGKMLEWQAFLRREDPHLPGIRKTADNLPAALCYGLEAMFGPGKVDGDEVLALARWLVRRMVNRFAAADSEGAVHQTNRLADRLLQKLRELGPMAVRELVRKHHNLKTEDCRKALALLAEYGLVKVEKDLWSIPCPRNAKAG